MKNLDFNPYKSEGSFRKNYKLHDIAEVYVKNLLIQWGVTFTQYGGDKRYDKVWEKGEDKPDLLINYKGKKALIDWKGKHKPVWLVNKRALDSYLKWQNKLNIPVFIVFVVIDDEQHPKEIRFTSAGTYGYKVSEKLEWDKNSTVEFFNPLPQFTKPALLYLLKEQKINEYE